MELRCNLHGILSPINRHTIDRGYNEGDTLISRRIDCKYRNCSIGYCMYLEADTYIKHILLTLQLRCTIYFIYIGEYEYSL